jgi:hypothetical protein
MRSEPAQLGGSKSLEQRSMRPTGEDDRPGETAGGPPTEPAAQAKVNPNGDEQRINARQTRKSNGAAAPAGRKRKKPFVL